MTEAVVRDFRPLAVEDVISITGLQEQRPDVADEVRKYSHWKRTVPSAAEIGQYYWFVDRDPKTVVGLVTGCADQIQVREVAKNYLRLLKDSEFLQQHGRFVNKINSIRQRIREGKKLPPLIAVRGRISRGYHLLDGVHRSLAFVVESMENPALDYKMDVFCGRKGIFHFK